MNGENVVSGLGFLPLTCNLIELKEIDSVNFDCDLILKNDFLDDDILTKPFGVAQTGSVRNGGFKFAAHKKLPLPTEDENDSQTVLGNSGLPRKILHGEAGDDEDEETEKLRYRLAKVTIRAFCSAQNLAFLVHRKWGQSL